MLDENVTLTETGGGSRKIGGDGPLSRSLEQNQGDLRGGDDASREEILDSFLQEYERVKNTPFVDRLADPSGVRANMLMPLEQIPDLFLAVPVWYIYQGDGSSLVPFEEIRRELYSMTDPQGRSLRAQQRFFINLFGNQLWTDLYQIFNRKWRTISDYTGDTIPSSLAIRMEKAREIFDTIVICTPYHHVALEDFEEIATWRPERHPEPYALGLLHDKETYPFAVVLGRFIEDGGLFPEYSTMVEHTMSFLRRIVRDLEKLNATDPNTWYHRERQTLPLGTRLTKQVELLLNLHESKILTDVLRQNPQLT